MAWTTGRPINTDCLAWGPRCLLSTRKVFEEGGGGLSIGKNTVALRVLQYSGSRSILRNVKILEFLKFYKLENFDIDESKIWN